jgi:thiamine biosynthesis protein ThiS
MTLNLTINGELRQYSTPITIAGLMQQLALSSRKVAIERNREIVPRSLHETTLLGEGDVIEIVEFIGGG